jgi:alginate O-acetyltransferase complex protein AlgI
VAAARLDREPVGSPRRRAFLTASIAANLGLLAFFKYTNLAMDWSEWLLGHAGLPQALPRLGLVLPMGISFYTFGSMSYTLDVYRQRLRPVSRFRDLYFFVTFFPHLVAGPIIRAGQFFYQVPRPRRPRLQVWNEGAHLIVRGLFLKMVCADNIASVLADNWPAGYRAGAGSTDLVLMTLLFGGQIYCDFEGYSSIARGLAYLLGWRFPLNFREPYIASTFSGFWERWHITLSRWLRDYLYIPLGGNRVSRPRTYLNLLTVMLLGGLWHGAAMTFVVWGAIHGVALAVERLLGFNELPRRPDRLALRLAWYAVVQVVVMVAWIFFRSETLDGALAFVCNIARLDFSSAYPPIKAALAYLLPVVTVHVHRLLVECRWVPPARGVTKAVVTAVMLYSVLVLYGATTDFIYFQF